MNSSQPRRPPGIGRPSAARLRRRRLVDLVTRLGIGVGGISVISAVAMILIYLLWVVWPMFTSGSVTSDDRLAAEAAVAEIIHLQIEEGNQAASLLFADGTISFLSTESGERLSESSLELQPGVRALKAVSSQRADIIAVLLSDGELLLMRLAVTEQYSDVARLPELSVQFPFGRSVLSIPEPSKVQRLALAGTDDRLNLAAADASGYLRLFSLRSRENFLTGVPTLEILKGKIEAPGSQLAGLQMSSDLHWLYLTRRNGEIVLVDIADPQQPSVQQSRQLLDDQHSVTGTAMLGGGISLLVADDGGRVQQVFAVRQADNSYQLQSVRTFETDGMPVTQLLTEPRRKGFIAIDQSGTLNWFHTTAGRHLLTLKSSVGGPLAAAMSPRGNRVLLLEDAQLRWIAVDNPHPEVSWENLWAPVWYENYAEKRLIWQSSAGNDDVEPKLSLTPLAFGTLKAAFYAMLFAIPLAIAAAVYTACFMAPRMRRTVKPTIELIEALPTVILGFLAGLWLAPYVERNLASVFNLMILLPAGVLLFGLFWTRLPHRIRSRVPAGWHAALLIPVVLVLSTIAIVAGPPIESQFFEGSLSAWLSEHAGIDYDQRNALIVGIAMGFAVVPTIYSLAEDALFGVPRSLTHGSLALGATRWQTLTQVVLPTASPGIFSALMIGFGRAIGETMIVLMATGNTPLMDLNLFEGMRSLSANIAVEMPESELNSTHYRVLFLSALVLFVFTFLVNTAADIVRQRLRYKYSVMS